MTCKMPLEAKVCFLRASPFAPVDSTAPPIPILPGNSPRPWLTVLFASSPRIGPTSILSRPLVILSWLATTYYLCSLVTSMCSSIYIVPSILIIICMSLMGFSFTSFLGFNPTGPMACPWWPILCPSLLAYDPSLQLVRIKLQMSRLATPIAFTS